MKGFGFISGEDGKEYFVHQTALKEGVTLHENDAVTFDVEQGDRGPKAANVCIDEGGDDAPEATEEAAEETTEETAEESTEEATEEKKEE